MNKLFALWRNEWTKTSRKKSLYILLAITLIVMLLIGGYLTYNFNQRTQPRSVATGNIDSFEEQTLKDELVTRRTNLDELKKSLADLPVNQNDHRNEDDLIAQINDVNRQIRLIELGLKYRVNIYNGNYQVNLLEQLVSLEVTLQNNQAGSQTEPRSAAELEKEIQDVLHALSLKDYAQYIDFQKNQIAADKQLSEEAKQVEYDLLDYELKVNPQGSRKVYNRQLRDEYRAVSQQLMNHVKGSPPSAWSLTVSDQNHLIRRQQVLQYHLSRNVSPSRDGDYQNIPFLMISLGSLGVMIILIILGGSAISQELATGSIKSLIVAPVRRQKIFWGKLLQLLSLGLVLQLIVFLITLIFSYLFIEPFYLEPYAWSNGSNVYALGFPLHLLVNCLSRLSSIWAWTLFAFMLSTVSRNSSLAVGLTTAIQFGLATVYTFMRPILASRLLALMPFEHTNLTERILSQSVSSNNFNIFAMGQKTPFYLDLPATFSYSYWLVMAACLIWIARDSFVKRDL